MIGTTLRTKADWNENIFPALTTKEGWMLFGNFTGAVPTDIGHYATGCIATSDDDGNVYKNIGTPPAPNFVLLGGGGGGNQAVNETPAGAINNVNTIFTLLNSPSPAGSLQLYLNGAFQTAGGVDYTLAGSTITFVNPPQAGSVLRAFYNF